MRIVVCAKRVPDPDTVDPYAVAGRLKAAPISDSLEIQDTTLLMYAYDEQPIEAALPIRDAGVDCAITFVSLGDEEGGHMFRPAFAMGADAAVLIADFDCPQKCQRVIGQFM